MKNNIEIKESMYSSIPCTWSPQEASHIVYIKKLPGTGRESVFVLVNAVCLFFYFGDTKTSTGVLRLWDNHVTCFVYRQCISVLCGVFTVLIWCCICRSLQRTLNELKEYQKQHDHYLHQQESLDKYKLLQEEQILRNIIHETQMAKEAQLGKMPYIQLCS